MTLMIKNESVAVRGGSSSELILTHDRHRGKTNYKDDIRWETPLGSEVQAVRATYGSCTFKGDPRAIAFMLQRCDGSGAA